MIREWKHMWKVYPSWENVEGSFGKNRWGRTSMEKLHNLLELLDGRGDHTEEG